MATSGTASKETTYYANFWETNCPVSDNLTECSELISKTVLFVKEKLEGNDASHDWEHIRRVWRMAQRIAKEEGVLNTEDVELAALLHDIDDWKYSGDEKAGVIGARQFLIEQNVNEEKANFVAKIIQGVGFKDELANDKREMFPELACVQDADRLDAIGAIGIARCFTYGGYKKRPLFDLTISPNFELTKNDYVNAKSSPTINHFFEKLFKLKDMMKTKTGRRIAEQRHCFMEEYVRMLFAEFRAEA